MDRAFHRALTEAGYMSPHDYVDMYGTVKDEHIAEFAEAVKRLGLPRPVERKPEAKSA